ncbi:hypothetical protein GQ53DRAFT_867189 [Thozetella sp. PMI_491]|nr:hypothetical protein GQ53DRAFT_867189 [Thozetella sp. PMI_491]
MAESSEARHDARHAETTAAVTTLARELRGWEDRVAESAQSSIQKLFADGQVRLTLAGTEEAVAGRGPNPAAIWSATWSDHGPGDDETGGEPPQHTMNRTVKTVAALWEEWTKGGPGRPSISALDRRWGPRWRTGRSREVQWYSLRREVILEAGRLAATRRIPMPTAVQVLDLDQRRTLATLNRFCPMALGTLYEALLPP